jgi:glycosyltransferase involved in cell wall biosynthesis
MKVSVITPVLNGERYIRDTLSSVRAQSYRNWEYIIVDGGSTDATRAICEEVMGNDPRCKIISGPDGGIYDAIFKGFEASTGEILTWINADDFFMPWAFAAATRYIKPPRARWLGGLPAISDSGGDIRYIDPSSWHPRCAIASGLFRGDILGWIQQEGIFFHNTLLKELSPPEIDAIRRCRLSGDFLLWTCFAKRQHLDGLPVVLASFRKHGNNRSLNQYPKYLGEIFMHGFRNPLPRAAAKLCRGAYQLLGACITKTRGRRYHDFD